MGLQHVCWLCRRKFPKAEFLRRHEKVSELHRQNVERQDELAHTRKDELKAAMRMVQRRVLESDSQLSEQVSPNLTLQTQRTLLEMKLRSLLFEYGQVQENMEDARTLKPRSRHKRACASRASVARELRVGRLSITASAASWQGNKEVQEDRYMLDIELESPDGQTVVGFCVLDGHSGSMCVDQLVDRLPANLQKCLSSKPGLTEEHLAQAVVEACMLTDDEFLQRARQHEVLDGSTMILGLIFQEDVRPAGGAVKPPGTCRLLIANVGDSRAVLCKATTVQGPGDSSESRLQAVRLSEDHKPIVPSEQKRIEAKGGIVDLSGVWRVFMPGPATFGGRYIQRWGLAVSRAFGDLLLKEPERYGCAGVLPGGLVTAVPEIRVVDLNPLEDRFLILACDGIWDVLGDDDAVAVCSCQAAADSAAMALVRRSFQAGSDDNLTALLVTWKIAEG